MAGGHAPWKHPLPCCAPKACWQRHPCLARPAPALIAGHARHHAPVDGAAAALWAAALHSRDDPFQGRNPMPPTCRQVPVSIHECGSERERRFAVARLDSCITGPQHRTTPTSIHLAVQGLSQGVWGVLACPRCGVRQQMVLQMRKSTASRDDVNGRMGMRTLVQIRIAHTYCDAHMRTLPRTPATHAHVWCPCSWPRARLH